jgi:predicted nucleic acid-binding protein
LRRSRRSPRRSSAGEPPEWGRRRARADLAWVDVRPVDERTAVTAGDIADEIAPDGPYLDGVDALIAAVGRELVAPVVSGDGDLTHPETMKVVDIEEY